MSTEQRTEPTLAERARTALAGATTAVLLARGCAARPGNLAVATVHDEPDGRPVVRLARGGPEFVSGQLATLLVEAPTPFRRLELTGHLAPCRAAAGDDVRYRLSPLACRLVGATNVCLPPDGFRAARPDPLRFVAPTLLEHLARCHTRDLVACVRAQGHHAAEAVVPLAVDRYGIELWVLSDVGVECVRLPFPGGPIDALHQAPRGLLGQLTCRCDATRG